MESFSVTLCRIVTANVLMWLLVITASSVLVEAAVSETGGKIATYPACKNDVERLCGKEPLSNDLAVLSCLQDRRSETDSDINKECHSV